MKLGILGTADIAFRRFLPALQKCPDITYAGVASRTPEKGEKFRETYGGQIYGSYDDLLDADTIDAVDEPLPPPFWIYKNSEEALWWIAEAIRSVCHWN